MSFHPTDATGSRLALFGCAAVVAGALGFGVFTVVENHRQFSVGDTRDATIVVNECWAGHVEVAGQLWSSASTEPVPAAFGPGPEDGTLMRTSESFAVFESAATGRVVVLNNGPFHSLACPLVGAP